MALPVAVVGFWLSGVGCWLLTVCVGCCSVFPLLVPSSGGRGAEWVRGKRCGFVGGGGGGVFRNFLRFLVVDKGDMKDFLELMQLS